MISPDQALIALPKSLREELVAEYRSILQQYLERRWSPSELSGGRFSEIVYCIVDGFGKADYPVKATKPPNMVDACRALEKVTTVPRSFQILIPRLLPALYEVRNNRGVGHVGGDVDPNHMDATAVLAMVSWIMGELVRVFHNLSIADAQQLVDSLAEHRIPLVWSSGGRKLVLDASLTLKEQILLLIASSPGEITTDDLFEWTEYENRSYFKRLLTSLHKERLVALSCDSARVQILPPGSAYIQTFLERRN
jgi:hypothetical protein